MPVSDPFGGRMTEPKITIEGVELTFAQAMALRVAASDLHMQMGERKTAEQVGERLAKNYRDRLAEVITLMTRGMG